MDRQKLERIMKYLGGKQDAAKSRSEHHDYYTAWILVFKVMNNQAVN